MKRCVSLCTGPDELQGYLEALIAKLLDVVRTGNSDTQETALGAIASAANAAGASFQPYVPAVFPVLRQYMEVIPIHPAALQNTYSNTISTVVGMIHNGDDDHHNCTW